jgi:hypothetical protein
MLQNSVAQVSPISSNTGLCCMAEVIGCCCAPRTSYHQCSCSLDRPAPAFTCEHIAHFATCIIMKPARPPEYARLPEEEPVVACELNHTLSASSGKQALLIRCIFFLTPLLLLSVVINIFLVLRSHESLGDFSRCESKYGINA